MSGVLWVLTLGALVAGCWAVDQTRQPGALGASVVESVVSLIRESCLFADDKRFLRRLAYVQSRDGTDPKTFDRSNYHGGIWQVDQDKFRETQTTSGLQNEKNIIRNTFGINWDYVSWSELRKPLYSGIAAALYTKLHSAVAWRIEDQANTYELLFQSSGGHNFTNLAKLLDQGCHGNETLDLVFVVDSSNSLSSDDFTRAKHFMNDVVDAFNIASDKTRVSVITYSTTPRIAFYLSSYSSKSSLKNAIQHLPFHPGTTNTAAALQSAVNNVFASSRPHAAKVVIVITDGQSDDIIYTQHAADNAKNDSIIMFSVGVGSSIDTTELNYMASTPSCTHVFTMSGYDEIRALKEELIQSFCRETLPLDCKELYMNGIRKSGVYTIYPWEKHDPNFRPVQVYCDMDTEGGGWTAIQRRVNGEENFYRNWTEYKLGFGTPYGDYWIGNDAIHQLANGHNSSLLVTITPMNGGFVSFKMYNQFYVFGEDQNYRLQLANPGNGNLGDNLLDSEAEYRAIGMQFSTFDVDNDRYSSNCAEKFVGGWWFNMCHSAYLTGPWHSDAWRNPWHPQYTSGNQVNGTSMLIKSH